jgi:hypothetical protein
MCPRRIVDGVVHKSRHGEEEHGLEKHFFRTTEIAKKKKKNQKEEQDYQ